MGCIEPLGSTSRHPVNVGLDATRLVRGGPESALAEEGFANRPKASREQSAWETRLHARVLPEIASAAHFDERHFLRHLRVAIFLPVPLRGTSNPSVRVGLWPRKDSRIAPRRVANNPGTQCHVLVLPGFVSATFFGSATSGGVFILDPEWAQFGACGCAVGRGRRRPSRQSFTSNAAAKYRG
jgi:hypothetical protein